MHLNLKGNLQENDKTKINNIFKVEKVAYLKKYIFFLKNWAPMAHAYNLIYLGG
jgi:hypothetical protein